MSREIRTVAASELPAWIRQRGIGFLRHDPEALGEYAASVFDLERTWAALDDGRIVGTLRSFRTALTVPGPAQVPAGALTNVTVAPTHRRRGLLSDMIGCDLRRCAELGDAVSILIASEYPIYGRYGYGPAAEGATYTVATQTLRFGDAPGAAAEGAVELVDRAAMRQLGPPVYERFRADQPGSIERRDSWWERELQLVELPGAEPSKDFWAVHRSAAGEPEGFARYTARQEWEGMVPKGTMELHELVAATPAAYRALWAYCAGVDLLTTIEAGTRPVDEVLPLLLHDARLVRQTHRYDFVWVRILDTRAALAGRRYQNEGRLVLEVVDHAGFAGGRFALEGGPAGAACDPTDDAPDLVVPVASLGALYLGGVAASRLHAAGGLEERRGGAVARADRMFLTARAPWCATWF